MRWVRDNGIALFFGTICVLTLIGQAIMGQKVFNEDALAHHEATVSFWRYLATSHYGQAVLENWESEFLQFALFILATIWLVQRGSPESHPLDKETAHKDEKIGRYALKSSPSWAKAGGWRTSVYAYSLVYLFTAIFFATWGGQSVTGWNEYNSQQQEHNEPKVSWAEYVRSPDFWEDSFQNWQSEFLAVGSMAVFTIYLRAKGSSESKSVGAPHDATGDA
jgi:hypothetical protein